MNSGTRKKLLQTRIKLGWASCKVDDYVTAKDAFAAADTIIPIKHAKRKKYVHKAKGTIS